MSVSSFHPSKIPLEQRIANIALRRRKRVRRIMFGDPALMNRFEL